MHFGNAERIEIETDERGFLLRVTSDEFGEATFRLDMDTAESLYDQARVDIKPWLLERDEARYRYAAFRCDPDESAGAYELSDPKHPRFHSVHVNLYDAREGK